MNETSLGGPRGHLPPTSWTLVLQAGQERSSRALGDLIEAYWRPAYLFVRRWGRDVEDAKDLTQGFFADLLARDSLAAVSPEKGRFRSFLLQALRHYLINESERQRAKKRGDGRKVLSLDVDGAESHLAREPAAPDDIDSYFRRQWALTVLERALERPWIELLATRTGTGHIGGT